MSNNVPINAFASELPVLSADGIPLGALTGPLISAWREGASSKKDWYWSTPERAPNDPTRDIIEITFSTPRLVNNLSFSTAHFPHTVRGEYRDEDTGGWYPLRLLAGDTGSNNLQGRAESFWRLPEDRPSLGPPTEHIISDSAPARVGSQAQYGFQHPQHFGADHWVPVNWRVHAVTTTRVRLVLVRNPYGIPPADQNGAVAAYSMGIRDWQVGYRVNSRFDIPRNGDVVTHESDFASSNDLLGSRVVYSMRESKPRNVTDGLDSTIWRSNPQPVNFAVVNFYADTRDALGAGQVVDRFFIDPTTVGAHVNLYYSNDEPDADYAASDEPLLYPISQPHGITSTPDFSTVRTSQRYIAFSRVYASFVDVDNSYLQFDPTKPWWLGMGLTAYGDTTDTDRPWLSFGQNTLRQNGAQIEFTTENGEKAVINLPESHRAGALFTIAVIWNPVASEDYPAGLTLVYRLGDLPAVQTTLAIKAFGSRPSTISFGRYPDFNAPGISGLRVRSAILKTKPPLAPEMESFTQDPYGFVRTEDLASAQDATTDNALLRMHPMFSDATNNMAGLVGGPGDVYDQMVWQPMAQDYTLKKGFMHLPPTRAKYWKFEFTRLVPEHYESFVPINRSVKVFTSQTVDAFRQIAGYGAWTPKHAGPGVQTALDLNDASRYSDAVNTLRQASFIETGQTSPTEGLVVTALSQVGRAKDSGWVWSYQPWHMGSSAPRFITAQRHQYETVKVQHRSKVGFFAGLKTLRAYRVNYVADDDVKQYVEHFHDSLNIESSNGFVLGENHLTGSGFYSVAVSKTFASHRPVRALQFATTQTDSHQVLVDDGFVSDDLGEHWEVYGDAQLTRDPITREVFVNRGWYAKTYGQISQTPGTETYGALEGRLYGEIEGGQPNGLAGGGIRSEAYHPSSSGRLYGAAQITATKTLTAPVLVQLVATQGDIVLAETQVSLSGGETVKVFTGYTVGSNPTPLLYSGIEGTSYDTLNNSKYGDFESRPLASDVYVRVMQVGNTNDQFTVKRLSIFDDPIAWEFSVDGGATWYDAMDVRNDPNGVLTFPVAGTALKWRVRAFRPNATINALAIRPWYGGLLGSIPSHGGAHVDGPNRSVMDQFPTIETDPMWQQWSRPIPRSWYDPPAVTVAQPEPTTPAVPLNPPSDSGNVVPNYIIYGTETLPAIGDSASFSVTPGIGTVQDDFNRPDYQPLGNATPSGLAWAQITGPGTVEIRSGKAQAVGGATRNRLDIGGPDQHFRITLAGYDALAIGFRVTDLSNRYEIQLNRNSWSLFRIQSGTPTLLVSDSSYQAGHQGFNYVYRVHTVGGLLEVYRGSSLLVSYTDPTPLVAGVGMDMLLGTDGDTADDLTKIP